MYGGYGIHSDTGFNSYHKVSLRLNQFVLNQFRCERTELVLNHFKIGLGVRVNSPLTGSVSVYRITK